MPDIPVLLILALGFIIFCWIFSISLKNYNIAIFLAAISPGFPIVMQTNAVMVSADQANIGSYIRIVTIIFLGAAGLLVYLKGKWEGKKKLPIPFILLGMFILFALMTTIYSYDRQYTFVRAGSFLAFYCFLIGFYFWLTDFPRFYDTLTTLFYLSVFVILLNAAALFIFPHLVWWWQQPYRYQGVWGHPNSLGALLMVTYPLLLWKYQESAGRPMRAIIMALLCVAVFMHIMTGSRASLFSALLGGIIWLYAGRHKIKMFALGAALLVALATVSNMEISSFQRKSDKGIMDVTGRDEMWSTCIALIKNRPFFGYGFDVEGKVWADARLSGVHYSQTEVGVRASLHNGYISVMIGTGIPSLIFLVILWLWPVWRMRGLPPLRYKLVALYIISGSLFMNFFETTISGGRSDISSFFWIAWVMALRLPYLSSGITALRLEEENATLYFSTSELERYTGGNSEIEKKRASKERNDSGIAVGFIENDR